MWDGMIYARQECGRERVHEVDFTQKSHVSLFQCLLILYMQHIDVILSISIYRKASAFNGASVGRIHSSTCLTAHIHCLCNTTLAYTCIQTHAHTYTHAHAHTYTHAQTHAYKHLYACADTHNKYTDKKYLIFLKPAFLFRVPWSYILFFPQIYIKHQIYLMSKYYNII